MDIQVLNFNEIDGKVEVTVSYSASIENLTHKAAVTVWVEASDSIKTLRQSAKLAAQSFLSRAADHDPGEPGQ